MAEGRGSTVQTALEHLLKFHNLDDHVTDIDDIVLDYVVSILEDLGDGGNIEENIDVDEFVEMMEAYIPGFTSIDSVEVCEWMFELASALSSRSPAGACGSEPVSPAVNCDILPSLTACAPGGRPPQHDYTSSGESERSISESSDGVDEQVLVLAEMFPDALRVEVEHCLRLSEGDVETAVQYILHREETGTAITAPASKTKRSIQKQVLDTKDDDDKMKKQLIGRYAYIDEDEDKKKFNPRLPKTEAKKMVRYRDNQVVNTKGQRFTDVKKPDTEEMKKTYISLKPARKYRFH